MSLFELPTIRIEVERMKYQVIHALSLHNDAIEQAVDTELSRAIENYPFAQQVESTAYEVITDAIRQSMEQFFRYGEGFDVINQVVSNAIKGAFDKKGNYHE